MFHVRVNHIPAVPGHDAFELLHAFLVGGDLGLDVSDIHVRAARRVFRRRKQRAKLGFAETSPIDQKEVIDYHAFFFQRAGERGR
jgi:hypothetical protein